jgi:hypothetical protein
MTTWHSIPIPNASIALHTIISAIIRLVSSICMRYAASYECAMRSPCLCLLPPIHSPHPHTHQSYHYPPQNSLIYHLTITHSLPMNMFISSIHTQYTINVYTVMEVVYRAGNGLISSICLYRWTLAWIISLGFDNPVTLF